MSAELGPTKTKKPPTFLKSELAVEFYVRESLCNTGDAMMEDGGAGGGASLCPTGDAMMEDGGAGGGAAADRLDRQVVLDNVAEFINDHKESFERYAHQRYPGLAKVRPNPADEAGYLAILKAQKLEPGQGIGKLYTRFCNARKVRANGGQRAPPSLVVEFHDDGRTLAYVPPPPPPPPPPPLVTVQSEVGDGGGVAIPRPAGRSAVMWDENKVNAALSGGTETFLIGITPDGEPVEVRVSDGVILRPDLFASIATSVQVFSNFRMSAKGPDYNDIGTAKSRVGLLDPQIVPKGRFCLEGTCACCRIAEKTPLQEHRELALRILELKKEEALLYDSSGESMDEDFEEYVPSAETLAIMEEFQRRRAAHFAPPPPRVSATDDVDELTRDMRAFGIGL